MPMKKTLVRNFAAPVKCRTQNSAEQVRFSKLCIAGLHWSSLFVKYQRYTQNAYEKKFLKGIVSPLFATLPCDEKKFRMRQIQRVVSFKALRREDRGLPEIVSKWSFGQFRSAFLSFTVNTTMIHRYYSWELWGKRIIQQPFYTNTSLSFWGLYIYIL